MSGKNKGGASSLADELAAMRQDVPAVIAAVSKPAAPSPVPAARPVARPVASPTAVTSGGELREKTSITLTPGAASALRRLQSFLMVDCQVGTVPAAVAVNLALELAAGGLPGNRDQLLKLLADNRQADKRRKSRV